MNEDKIEKKVFKKHMQKNKKFKTKINISK